VHRRLQRRFIYLWSSTQLTAARAITAATAIAQVQSRKSSPTTWRKQQMRSRGLHPDHGVSIAAQIPDLAAAGMFGGGRSKMRSSQALPSCLQIEDSDQRS
jgi:hypothetical protein